MTVSKIFYRFIESPDGDDSIKEVAAPEDSVMFSHLLEPIEKGNYKVEYWALDDSGKESDKKYAILKVGANVSPKPYKGGLFTPNEIGDGVTQVFFKNCNITLEFNRDVTGLGVFFDWASLNLQDIVVEQDRLEIPANSWLYKQMVEAKSSFSAKFYSSCKKKLVVKKQGGEFVAMKNGLVNPLVADMISDLAVDGRTTSFRVLKPAIFLMR
jgi:hypothetical protein